MQLNKSIAECRQNLVSDKHSKTGIVQHMPTVHSKTGIVQQMPTVHSKTGIVPQMPTVHSKTGIVQQMPTVHTVLLQTVSSEVLEPGMRQSFFL